MKKPKAQVVVITGASSGNGRAVAIEFAKEKANLVLASRNLKALGHVVDECKALNKIIRLM